MDNETKKIKDLILTIQDKSDKVFKYQRDIGLTPNPEGIYSNLRIEFVSSVVDILGKPTNLNNFKNVLYKDLNEIEKSTIESSVSWQWFSNDNYSHFTQPFKKFLETSSTVLKNKVDITLKIEDDFFSINLNDEKGSETILAIYNLFERKFKENQDKDEEKYKILNEEFIKLKQVIQDLNEKYDQMTLEDTQERIQNIIASVISAIPGIGTTLSAIISSIQSGKKLIAARKVIKIPGEKNE